MKILCDSCGQEAAVVFCCADQAALCVGCDNRVHRANKLASKHRRFLLSSPQSNPVVCDVCKERHGFVFCQEDRAILCRECDGPIHSANPLTAKHNRFLLTGVRLYASPISVSSPESEVAKVSSETSNLPFTLTANSTNRKNSAGAFNSCNQNAILTANNNFSTTSVGSNGSFSGVSEYLIKMCPGWRAEDLLIDNTSATLDDFSKMEALLPFRETSHDTGGIEAIVAPHVPEFNPSVRAATARGYAGLVGDKEGICGGQQQSGVKVARQRRNENMSTVPDMSSAMASGSKRTWHSIWY